MGAVKADITVDHGLRSFHAGRNAVGGPGLDAVLPAGGDVGSAQIFGRGGAASGHAVEVAGELWAFFFEKRALRANCRFTGGTPDAA